MSQFSLYQYGKLGFWAAIGVILVAAIGITLGELGIYLTSLSILVQDPSNGFFESSLNLILSIISLVFLVVIFLLQNANQEYSSRLSSVILHDKYFLWTIGFILTASIFNISGSYFSWGPPLTVIGYAFSISTALLVGALIAFAGYFIDISNIIDYITEDLKQQISQDRIYRTTFLGTSLQDEDYVSKLNTDAQLIVSTCIQAIEQNQQNVVNSCLDALTEIVKKYLKETDDSEVNDDFINELNDQFQFIGAAAFDDYTRQKYSESVVETVGDIGLAITKDRELGTPGSRWANLLKSQFEDSLEFDRTAAAHIALRKLGEMSTTAILNGDLDSYRVYQGKTDSLARLCATASDSFLANLLQNAHLQYQRMYVTFLRMLCTEGYAPDTDVSMLFDDFAESFNQAKENYDFYTNQVLYAALFGLEPFAARVGGELQQHQGLDPATQRSIADYLSELIDFLRRISLQSPEHNHKDIYKGYTQFLFALENSSPVDEDIKKSLLSDLNNNFTNLIKHEYTNSLEESDNLDLDINRRITDFYAMLIYFYQDDPDALATFITPLVELYTNLADSYPSPDTVNNRTLHQLYQELKIFGAWISQFHDPENVCPELMDVLIENFEEIDTSTTRFYTSTLERYDYPTNTFDYRGGWWLRPDAIWSNRFQENISDTLNGDGNYYQQFHEELRDRQEDGS
ncbi:hypothetical protein [Haloarcula sebkhae]|uniref:Uncharacterized protein n=1 Tax=Haloarcula sebkhae TaxID=932660 RepID=A0ACC6VRI1_9EURY|nr:hypothetical protein [Haloarcula sebkhae]